MRVVVTGGAGFIGSNLVRALAERGDDVVAVDNLVTGRREHLDDLLDASGVSLVVCDIVTQPDDLPDLFRGAEAVVHLAANADVRYGLQQPRSDLEQNVIGTHNVLEAVRHAGVDQLVFSSTGSIYGESEVIPTPEDAPFPVQTSLYGASKLACEGFVAAYTEGFGINATVYRFVSILGRAYWHGHVRDFVDQLIEHPDHLHILGDGKQRKSYLEVTDCADAIVGRLGRARGFEVFNLGVRDYCTVDESAGWICERLGVDPRRTYSGGRRGWVGDNPFIFLDTTRIEATGWHPRFTIREAVERTVDSLVAHQAVRRSAGGSSQ
ncbi:MAG TPA: NAD-dependent epimerase/dehydratase family protein [Acidimicrobiia bacterium]|nr:NAD-dependent epimerase/dehydratase family protein [Acidimicrobiia bacterium]